MSSDDPTTEPHRSPSSPSISTQTNTTQPSLPRLLRGLTSSNPTGSAASVSRHASSSSTSAITTPTTSSDLLNEVVTPTLRRVRSSLLSSTSIAPPLLSPSLNDLSNAFDQSISTNLATNNKGKGRDDHDSGNDSDSSGFASILSRVKHTNTTPQSSSISKNKRKSLQPPQSEDVSTIENNRRENEGEDLGEPTLQTIEAAKLAAESSRRVEEEQSRSTAKSSDEEEDDVDGGVEIEIDSSDEDDEEQGHVVRRAEGQPDPRDMLRAQLKRNETGLGASAVLRREKVENEKCGIHYGLDDGAHAEAVFHPFICRQIGLYDVGERLQSTSLSPFAKGFLAITHREPDEEAATGYVGVMQAIISIFADEGDKLRYVDAGSVKVSFVLKAPLYLVCVSDWGEPESVLRTHLDYLYLQVLSIVTHTQLSGIFSKRSNFDLRRLMQGTEPFFFELVKTLQTSLAVLTSSLEVYRVDPSTRDEVAKALLPSKHKSQAQSLGLLYAFVISSGRIVTLLRPTRHTIHPTDLHLLLSTISSSSTFRAPDSESWIPVCLPRFNNKGFLHVYISYLTSSTGVVLVSAEKDGFEGVKNWGEEVKQTLREKKLLDRLESEKAKAMQEYSIGELAIPGLRHFLYKSRSFVQITNPVFEGDYDYDVNKMRLIGLYQRLYDSLHPRPSYAGGASRPPAKLVYLRTEHEAVLGWTTSAFELYLAVSPLLPKTAVVSAARAVTKWAKSEESRLFLTSAPSF